MGLKYPKALSRPVVYDGEQVWKSGDWFGALYFGGTRCLAVLRPFQTKPHVKMSFPWLIQSDRTYFPSRGKAGDQLHTILSRKDIVIDGMFAHESKEGDLTWIKEVGAHIRPNAVLYCDDLYSFKEFGKGKGKKPFSERRKRLVKLLRKYDDLTHIRLTLYGRITSKADLRKLQDRAARNNCTFILRKDCSYVAGKSGNILVGEKL